MAKDFFPIELFVRKYMDNGTLYFEADRSLNDLMLEDGDLVATYKLVDIKMAKRRIELSDD